MKLEVGMYEKMTDIEKHKWLDENLEEDMYVRTDRNGIDKFKFKVKREEYDFYEYYFEKCNGISNPEYYLIGKPSFNIIDLIEVRDYVNGKKVKSISISNKDEWCILFENEGEDWINSGDVIKTIVTKEQFEAMQYKVSEEVVE